MALTKTTFLEGRPTLSKKPFGPCSHSFVFVCIMPPSCTLLTRKTLLTPKVSMMSRTALSPPGTSLIDLLCLQDSKRTPPMSIPILGTSSETDSSRRDASSTLGAIVLSSSIAVSHLEDLSPKDANARRSNCSSLRAAIVVAIWLLPSTATARCVKEAVKTSFSNFLFLSLSWPLLWQVLLSPSNCLASFLFCNLASLFLQLNCVAHIW
mmetsp:Transcript_95027/g.188256  ORF Transcript_95027/g.188256 Transcript_95027/m.188256 type:complete len:209 (+) Transcript_95027:1173-1799(+)